MRVIVSSGAALDRKAGAVDAFDGHDNGLIGRDDVLRQLGLPIRPTVAAVVTIFAGAGAAAAAAGRSLPPSRTVLPHLRQVVLRGLEHVEDWYLLDKASDGSWVSLYYCGALRLMLMMMVFYS